MTRPTMNQKLEDFKGAMYDKHEACLRASMELVKVSNELLFEPLEKPLYKTMRTIARVVTNSNGAVLTSAVHGYGNDAAKIARSMFEGTVNMKWLRKNPQRLNDYFDYYKVRLWMELEAEAAKDPGLKKRLGKERVAEMRKDHDLARPRFLDKNKKHIINSWCRLSIRQRAIDVNLGTLYPSFYAKASGMIHMDLGGLLTQAAPGKADVEVAPSEAWVGESLTMGYLMTYAALDELNDAAKLKYTDTLTKIHQTYQEGVKKAAPPQAAAP